MAGVIVADASPLIVLGRIGRLELLVQTCGQVIVPDAVRSECMADMSKAGARAIGQAFEAGWLSEQPAHLLFQAASAPGLDAGEAAAIGLAYALHCPILIDERLGRAVALQRGVVVMGTLGVFLRAKLQGLTPAVGPLLQALKEQGYFLSTAVEQEVLRRAGELPG